MTCHCNNLCTSKISIFESLTISEQKMLIAKTQHLDYKPGNTIFEETEVADKIIIIRYGKIKINRYSYDGKEYILDILSQNDIYGEQNIFNSSKYEANAIALEHTGICTISLNTVNDLIMQHPEVGIKLLNVLGKKLSSAMEMKEILSKNDAKAKIAAFLLAQTNKTSKVALELTRDDISATINLRRETISRKLNELQNEGAISLKGHKFIKITDKDILKIASESEK